MYFLSIYVCIKQHLIRKSLFWPPGNLSIVSSGTLLLDLALRGPSLLYSLTEATATRWRCCSLVCTLLRLRPALVASTHPVTRDLTEARHDVREHG